MSPDDVVLPAVPPAGNFRPLCCCLCGRVLREVRYCFFEGSICATCFACLGNSARENWRDWMAGKEGAK